MGHGLTKRDRRSNADNREANRVGDDECCATCNKPLLGIIHNTDGVLDVICAGCDKFVVDDPDDWDINHSDDDNAK